ncbi:hypothetical protein IU450_27995 [Nocardia abscessus]|uniref:hypothetical protein n=1 Tax=Nocardia abscessus TaxID=120957 RepID=UPI001895D125|nr:hypothetical protein [Nocardia abscessus]MBF6339705.1 hypothetical protein [Nocardia abscessus]
MTWSEWNPIDAPPLPFDALTRFNHSFFFSEKWITAQFNASSSWVRRSFLASAPQSAQDQLLRHEQYHLLLVGAIAAQAITAMRSGGTPPRTAWQQYKDAVDRETKRYDKETDHGRKRTAQQVWESNIDNQNVVFP